MTPTSEGPPTPPVFPNRPVLRILWTHRGQWRARHQLPLNLALHLGGIPLVVAGIVLLFVAWYWGVALIVLGYLLQYLGHQAEGNDVGEWAAISASSAYLP